MPYQRESQEDRFSPQLDRGGGEGKAGVIQWSCGLSRIDRSRCAVVDLTVFQPLDGRSFALVLRAECGSDQFDQARVQGRG